MNSLSKSIANAIFGALIIASTSFDAVSDDAQHTLEEIREIALQPDPNMQVLQYKIRLWLKLRSEGTAAEPAWLSARADAEQLMHEIEALTAQSGSSAALAVKFEEFNDLIQRSQEIFSKDYETLREAVAPLQQKQMDEVNIIFISERNKECLRHAANSPFSTGLASNPLRSQLINERLLDWQAGKTRPDSLFACAFLRKARDTVLGLFAAIGSEKFPGLSEQFEWISALDRGATPEEWIIYDNASDAVTLNAAGGWIVISELMASALVDVAVEEVFGSYDALEKQREVAGNENALTAIALEAKRLRDLAKDPLAKRATQQEFINKIFGGSLETIQQKVLRGEPITVESDPVVLFGAKEQAIAEKFNKVLEQMIAFALFHEMGHIALGHDHKKNPTCEVVHRMEYEADAFAASALAKQSGGVAGINRRGEFAGLETFYRRFADFGFANDIDCPHPSISIRFEKLETVYYSTKVNSGNQSLLKLQQQYSRENVCRQMPIAIQAKCNEKFRELGSPD